MRKVHYVLIVAAILLFATQVSAMDDGRYANSPLKKWFDALASGKGLCCSFADGVALQDVDWDMSGDHYIVRIEGVWYIVPTEALITVPNITGRAVVWPYKDSDGNVQIRCFMSGAAG